MERAQTAVKNARAAMHKKLTALQAKKLLRPDDMRRAQDQMEKMAAKGKTDIKETFEAGKKALQG